MTADLSRHAGAAKSCHMSGTPLSACSPRSSNCRPEPATRSAGTAGSTALPNAKERRSEPARCRLRRQAVRRSTVKEIGALIASLAGDMEASDGQASAAHDRLECFRVRVRLTQVCHVRAGELSEIGRQPRLERLRGLVPPGGLGRRLRGRQRPRSRHGGPACWQVPRWLADGSPDSLLRSPDR